ncbi:MAG: hypothetical protein IH964_12735 [Candidatus Dadabacteria bacterium]|nr:hypothetical protein [Candidatus Dadabacteria bacterium]
MRKYIIAVSVVALMLTQVSCVTYMVRTSREKGAFEEYCLEQGGEFTGGSCIDSSGKEHEKYEHFCIEQGGQFVGGDIFDWHSGKCIIPKDNIDINNLSLKQKCELLGGTYSGDGNCDLSTEQE